MIDKNKLSKDVEEQIQSLASDVYIQVEEKLTHLISTAVKAELSKTTSQPSKVLPGKEQSDSAEIAALKKALADKQTEDETAKQNFQVQLTQNTINYTETIESLEKQVSALKAQQSQKHDNKQTNDQKLEEKLLETQQSLNDKTHEIDGLNGRIMVLTEQEQSLTSELAQAKEQAKIAVEKQNETLNEAKKQITVSAQQQVEVYAKKLQDAENEVARVKAEASQSTDKTVQESQLKVTQLTEQLKKEQESKSEIQQKLTALEAVLTTERDANKQHEQSKQEALAKVSEQIAQKEKDHQAEIVQLNEQAERKSKDNLAGINALNEKIASERQRHSDEVKAIHATHEEAKSSQASAQETLAELEKANNELKEKIEIEQKDVQLYKEEIAVLNEQVKVAQEGQENVLQRFNSNRDKQEAENTKVRETIKFLRDENHQLTTDLAEQKTQFTDQVHELEHKVTEFRLKFEYAQKQLAK